MEILSKHGYDSLEKDEGHHICHGDFGEVGVNSICYNRLENEYGTKSCRSPNVNINELKR